MQAGEELRVYGSGFRNLGLRLTIVTVADLMLTLTTWYRYSRFRRIATTIDATKFGSLAEVHFVRSDMRRHCRGIPKPL